MLDNVRETLPIILDLVLYGSYCLGTVLVTLGVGDFIKISTDPRESSPKVGIGNLMVGGLFLSTGSWIPVVISSFTDDYMSSANILSYLGSASSGSPMEQMMKTIMAFGQFLGVLGILRGTYLFRAATSATQHGGEEAATSGLMFIGFGSLAANMRWTIQGLSWLLGFPVPTFLL